MPTRMVIPRETPVVKKKDLTVTEAWDAMLRYVQQVVFRVPITIGVVALSGQGAAIATTIIPTQGLDAGVYRVSLQARISRPASTSSAVTPTITWIDGGVSCSFSMNPVSGNTTSSQASATVLLRLDSQTKVSYSVDYVSIGATTAQYELNVILEQVQIAPELAP